MVGREKRGKGKKIGCHRAASFAAMLFFLRVTRASPPSCQGLAQARKIFSTLLLIVLDVLDVLDVAHILALITSGSLHLLTLGPIGLVTFFRWGP
jgi:hypothetical protein